jgi:DUF1680 family protein
VLYFGVWTQIPCQSVPDRRCTNNPFAACEVAFRGPLVRWLGSRDQGHGRADVYVDGDLVDTVDSYAPEPQAARVLFEARDLEGDRIHTLRIVVRRERHQEATDCVQGIDGFEVESVVDYPRELRAMAMGELKTIAAGDRPHLTPDQWEAASYAAEAPEAGVQLRPGVLRDAFERNIRYISSTAVDPCTGRWVEGLPASSEGRLLGAAAHTLRWEEREDLRAVVDEIVEAVKQRQDEDGYCLPYDRSYMIAQAPGFYDERRNYDRVNLTRGMVAAGRVGNADALPVMRRFYDWLNASGIYASLLAGPKDGSASNCNNGHEGGLLMYFSPVGKPEDVVALERYFVQDFFVEQMRRAEPLALCYYPLHTPHCYVLLAFKAWLDHYRATGAAKYLEAALGAWEVVHRYYEHVGGTIAICEEPAGTYPPQSYLLGRHTGETCGSVFWADINHRLLQFFPDREAYAAEIEKSIFNVILAAQDANGHIRYHNHLDRKKDPPTRINTCCEVMGAPFIARLPELVYSIDDEGLWVNLFAASRIAWTHDGKEVALDMATEFPRDGTVSLSIAVSSEATMSIRVRIPSWAADPVTVTINGTRAATSAPGTYLRLVRTWHDGDTIGLALPMDFRLTQYTGLDQAPRQWWEPAPVVPKHRYALSHGPLLMALVGATSLDFTPEDLVQALSPIEGARLHFAVRGRDDCHFEPYWALGEEQMTCFPALKCREARQD